MISDGAFNPLTNDKFLHWSKLKALADDKVNVTEKLKCALGRTENIGIGENAFSSFPEMFSKAFFLRLLKVGICLGKS